MAINTRGTEMWYADTTSNGSAKLIGCPTSITPVGGSRDSFESDACLSSGLKEKFAGGITWDDITISINLNPADTSHEALWDLFNSGAKTKFVIGFADGTAAATFTNVGGWVKAATRSWYEIEGTVTADQADFSGDSVVTATITIAPTTITRVKKST